MNSLHKEIEAAVARLLANGTLSEDDFGGIVSATIQEMIPELATEILKDLKETGPEHLSRRRLVHTEFQANNFHRWREAFDLLEMLYLLCEEATTLFAQEFGPEAAETNDVLFEALISLQARALLVSNEILCLLAGGYPDGALSRWRTLHEIGVVAMAYPVVPGSHALSTSTGLAPS